MLRIDRAAILPSICVGVAAGMVVWRFRPDADPGGKRGAENLLVLLALAAAAGSVLRYAQHVRERARARGF